MTEEAFDSATSLAEGPLRVAALAAWVQSLAPTEDSKPVLVGGAAVELYSGGAYITGDLDFAGSLGKDAARQLQAHGFEKHGRHWIHEEHEIFLEFPSATLDKGERAATIEIGGYTVLVVGLEELIVDRLAAWQFWRSEVDGVNAFLLVRASAKKIDWTRLRQLAERRDLVTALDALERIAIRHERKEISNQELESWSRDGLAGTE